VIDKGVEMPPKVKRTSASRDVAEQMEMGDSVLCESPAQAATLRWALYLANKKGSVRKTRQGWRVWRVE
jgi:hypothetical protein